jgi:hypothetical protein
MKLNEYGLTHEAAIQFAERLASVGVAYAIEGPHSGTPMLGGDDEDDAIINRMRHEVRGTYCISVSHPVCLAWIRACREYPYQGVFDVEWGNCQKRWDYFAAQTGGTATCA